MNIEFCVYGRAVPQGSKQAFLNKRTGRPILVESSHKNLSAWRKQIQIAAGQQMDGKPLLQGPLFMQVRFFFQKPKSAPKKREIMPAVRPDWDKLSRAVCDALTGVVYRDDAQIVSANIRKLYGDPPRVEINVIEYHIKMIKEAAQVLKECE